MIKNLTYAKSYEKYYPYFSRTLVLGSRFHWNGFTLRFVKVTKKGFNFLVENSNECLLDGHLYYSKWSGKKIPEGENVFHFMRIPEELKNMKKL